MRPKMTFWSSRPTRHPGAVNTISRSRRMSPTRRWFSLTGDFLVKVYEGPYRDAGKWVKDMQSRVVSAGKQLRKLYFFYTTCPKCAKHYGKNYVVAFAEI